MAQPGSERRQQPRRQLPFLRCAIVQSSGAGHLVTIRDLSRGGAFLESRAGFEPQTSFRLDLILPGMGGHVSLPCELVRSSPANGKPMGLAVRFGSIDARAEQLIDEFVARKKEDEEQA